MRLSPGVRRGLCIGLCLGLAAASASAKGRYPDLRDSHDPTFQAGLDELLKVEVGLWKDEIPSIEEHFAKFGDKLPEGLRDELHALEKRLNAAS